MTPGMCILPEAPIYLHWGRAPKLPGFGRNMCRKDNVKDAVVPGR